jgi:hypothetical protein
MHLIDNVIDTMLLPALLDGRSLSLDGRKLLSLPTRLVQKIVCQELTSNIFEQNNTTTDHRAVPVHQLRRQISNKRNQRSRTLLNDLRSNMTTEQIRANDIAQQKGSSIWLTALPLANEGYVLNKRDFYEAIYLRHRWQLKRLPSYCACGKSFTVDHAVSCLKDGFVHRRHDEIHDLLATVINEVAYDVSTEPALTPLTGEVLPPSANSADDARVDIAARGFWQRCEKAFFDVRVFNPYAPTLDARVS